MFILTMLSVGIPQDSICGFLFVELYQRSKSKSSMKLETFLQKTLLSLTHFRPMFQ